MGADQSAWLGGDAAVAQCKCRIVIVGPKIWESALLALATHLPPDARIIATGSSLEELMRDDLFCEGNVLLNVSGTSQTLPSIIDEMPHLTWIHSINCGVDNIMCPEIADSDIVLTNAKGVFSSNLAEYALFACSYFAKDLPRLRRQQAERQWEKYYVGQLRGATMGIVGYGDIGAACARLAKAYGMRVLALRRNPDLCSGDANVDQAFGAHELGAVMSQADYLIVCMALTPHTRQMIREEHFKASKKGLVLVNIGRGALLDEEALIRALQSGDVAGAALDVFAVEPLPEESPLWALPNVLVSPHTADLTPTSRYASVQLFTENCARFLRGQELGCVVDKNVGY
ncbi:D-isomer specific 2-hydroxyacid dehydrogenase [Ochromonadaceae sp. CCMP2298]|nr:D-isomer specific 2-hydroxyacid dehydrogenase [Ochromonadaceae sp. CCMP2298]